MTNSKQANYWYFLVPAIFLIIFIGIYVKFDQGFERRQAEARALEKKRVADQIEAENRSRAEAVKQAEIEGARRKAEREAREKADQKRRDDLQAAFQARDKAQIDDANQRDRVDSLRRGVATAKEEVKHIQVDLTQLEQQKSAVEAVEKAAQENVQQLTAVLDQIDAADRAAELAKAQAEKQKKS